MGQKNVVQRNTKIRPVHAAARASSKPVVTPPVSFLDAGGMNSFWLSSSARPSFVWVGEGHAAPPVNPPMNGEDANTTLTKASDALEPQLVEALNEPPPESKQPTVALNRRTRREAVRQRIDLDQPGFLRLEDVLTLIPVSRATWYAMVKAGEAPQQVALFRRAVAWRTQDIRTLIDRLSGAGAPAAAITTLKGVPTP